MKLRKQLGSAIWLYELLSRLTPTGWDGSQRVLIAEGTLLTDVELAAWLKVKPSTAAIWRRRLKAAGFLDWLVSPGFGRALFLRGITQAFEVPTPVIASVSVPESGDRVTVDEQTKHAESKAAAQFVQGWTN